MEEQRVTTNNDHARRSWKVCQKNVIKREHPLCAINRGYYQQVDTKSPYWSVPFDIGLSSPLKIFFFVEREAEEREKKNEKVKRRRRREDTKSWYTFFSVIICERSISRFCLQWKLWNGYVWHRTNFDYKRFHFRACLFFFVVFVFFLPQQQQQQHTSNTTTSQ